MYTNQVSLEGEAEGTAGHHRFGHYEIRRFLLLKSIVMKK